MSKYSFHFNTFQKWADQLSFTTIRSTGLVQQIPIQDKIAPGKQWIFQKVAFCLCTVCQVRLKMMIYLPVRETN